MSPLTTLIVLGTVGWVWAAPILPLPYQLVYLSPDPYGYHIPSPPEPVLTNRVSDEPVESPEDQADRSYEVTQFHTEDQGGRIVYGFHSPDQVRMESRDPDGTVRGSYSYVDPYGNVVRMQYWDEGNGIHMAGNSLPVAMHDEPQYTPEVRAAREEHFRLYEAALATLRAAGLDDSPDHESERYPSGEYEEEPNTQSSEEVVAEEEAPPSDDTVIVENASVNLDRAPVYQKVPLSQPQQRPAEDDVSSDEDSEDDEAVAIDNPELLRTEWNRRGKSQDIAKQGNAQMSMEAAGTEHVEARAMKPEEPQEDKTAQKKETGGLSKPTDKLDVVKDTEEESLDKIDIKKVQPASTKQEVTPAPLKQEETPVPLKQEGTPAPAKKEEQQAERRSMTEEVIEEVPEARSFFYHFAHQVPHEIPLPVERVDEDVTEQLEDLKKNYKEIVEAAAAQLTAAQQSATVAQESVSSRASGLGAIPVAAVHDSQVSPFQRPLIPNFHLRPVYVPPLTI